MTGSVVHIQSGGVGAWCLGAQGRDGFVFTSGLLRISPEQMLGAPGGKRRLMPGSEGFGLTLQRALGTALRCWTRAG